MNNQIIMENMDPLSYEAQYESYPVTNPYYPPIPYPYKNTYQPAVESKLQPSVSELNPVVSELNPVVSELNPVVSEINPVASQLQPVESKFQPVVSTLEPSVSNQDNTTNTKDTGEQIQDEEKDIKPDISKKKKPRGKTSSYWNKKIADKDFAFYGCAICNIAYNNLIELDQHVTIHENRLTSYDVRKLNLKKRKKIKKQKKKEKKEKIKEEFEVEIKPEDGYIGTEKAVDVKNNIKIDSVNNENKPENGGDENVNIYKCFGCDKKFALSYYLRIHVRSHTDEKPYTCSVCGQSFITASKLGRHNKRTHLAVRHQCRCCYRVFTRFELLVKHFDKMHADDKLEGEVYDYNAILPYLEELEKQMLQDDKKPIPKQEKMDTTPSYEVGVTKQEDVITKKEPPQECPNIAVNSDGIGTTTFYAYMPEELNPDIHIKEEVLYPEEGNLEVTDLQVSDAEVKDTEVKNFKVKVDYNEINDNDEHFADNDDDVKEEASNSDSEYFPSDTWSRPPVSPGGVTAGGSTCPICNKSLSSKSYLRVHMRTHTGEKPFKCYVCNRGFITASKMHRHVLTHGENGEGNPKTEIDENKDVKEEKVKDSKTKLKRPRKKAKTTEKKKKGYKKRHLVCEYCHLRFLHPETLQIHRKSHAGEALALRCQYCLDTAQDDVTLKEHEATHTGPKPYLCTICGNGYKKKETMMHHRKSHKFEDEKTFICDICSKKFNTQTRLRRHIISHSVEKFTLKYECPVCAHMFHTKYHVQMHLNTHMKEGLILEENRNAVLAMVLQNARKIPKLTESTSKEQETNMPIDERSRICNICGEIFQHFYYLEEHLKTHGSKIAVEDFDKVEEKKYTCQVCSKSFKLHYYLKLHSFTHTKEKPFICQQCGKGFITKGKLKRHLETHQGLKKYQCHICYKFFTRPSYLRIHVRTIHGTQDYNFRDYGVGVPIGAIGNC